MTKSVFALLFLLLSIACLNWSTMPAQECSGDAVMVRVETVTWINTGSLKIPAEVVKDFAGDRGQYFYLNEQTGAWYSKYGIGNTLVYAPALLLEKIWKGNLPYFSSARLQVLALLNILFAVGTATYLYLLTGHYTKSSWIKIAYILAAFYCTFWWNHMRIQAFEAFQPFFLIGAVYHFRNVLRNADASSNSGIPAPPMPKRDLLVTGLFLGLLCLIKTFFVILPPVFLVALAINKRKALFNTAGSNRPKWALLANYSVVLGIPLLVSTVTLLTLNKIKFGAFFETGYTQWSKLPDPMSGNIFAGLCGFFLDPQFSILTTFPVLMLALPGYPSFARRFRQDALFLLALGLVLLLSSSKFLNWSGGWSYGPRYLLPILGLMSLPFLLVLEWIVANFRRLQAQLAAVAIAATLLYSLHLQIQINTLPFFACNCVKSNLVDPLNDPELETYFTTTPFPIISGDILDVKAGKPIWWWSRVRQSAPADRRGALDAYFKKISSANYYFFPDP